MAHQYMIATRSRRRDALPKFRASLGGASNPPFHPPSERTQFFSEPKQLENLLVVWQGVNDTVRAARAEEKA
jgi:hypothetical protein